MSINRRMLRLLPLICSFTAVLLLLVGSAVAQQNLDANAKFCDDFFNNVVRSGKVEEASKYLTEDFIEHNVNLMANSRADFLTKLKAFLDRGGFSALRAPGATGAPAAPPQRTVFSHDDVVIFMSPMQPQDNPNNPGQKIVRTHFDVYRLRDRKIAEHWD